MKKIKMLCVTAATCLAAASPIVITTSCGGNKDIDIKTNPNIKIECQEIAIGKELVIKYTLDSGYAFDIEKSTITFEDSNTTISLIQCDVDRIHQTITVPGEFVTSKKVTIDIKAESSASSTVTQAEYTAAISTLLDVNENRKFNIAGDIDYYQQQDEKEPVHTMHVGLEIKANGNKDYEHELNEVIGAETEVIEAWSEKDSTLGYWRYMSENGSKPVKYNKLQSFVESGIEFMIDSEKWGRDISKFTYDPLYNAYYTRYVKESYQDLLYMKFQDKKIAYFGGIGGSSVEGETRISTNAYSVEYTAPTITIPTDWQYDDAFVHIDPDRYEPISTGVKYSYNTSENESFMGRYQVPLTKYNSWDPSKDIVVFATGGERLHMDRLQVLLVNNGNVIPSSSYDVDKTNGKVTINAGVIDGTKDLFILFDTKLEDGSTPSISNPTKIEVYQEA